VKVVVDISYVKDLRKLSDQTVLEKALDVVKQFEKAQSLKEISSIKKLKGKHSYYRKRLGNYRIGFSFQNEEIVIYRFLHRKDMYKYFP